MNLVASVTAHLGAWLVGAARAVLFDTRSLFSLLSLTGALLTAVASLAWERLRRRGRVSGRLMVRALRPRAAALGPSGRADLGWFLFNGFCAGLLIGAAILTQAGVSAWTLRTLTGVAGEHAAPAWAHGWTAAALSTLALFLVADGAYWIDHWLSHDVPWLWEIHKVHHTAEVLTPLTVFRVHPLESIKFANITALATGVADGVLGWGLGVEHGRLHLLGADAIWLVFSCTILHLQHSHVWISFPGRLGRIFLSPAHHQVHHSADPRHHGRNLGNILAVWDLLSGRLYIPSARREALRFGVDGEGAAAHTVTGGLITPVADAGRALVRSLPRPAGAVRPVDIPDLAA